MSDNELDLVGKIRLDTSELDQVAGRTDGLFRKIALAAGAAFAVDKIKDWGQAGIQVAADFENTSIAFKTMLGSGEKAQVFLTNLRNFARDTPFEFPELATAASKLVSVGISADKVIPIMTSLGNATSGMGTGSEGINRATRALQQMSQAGRITAEDLNQLTDAGVPAIELLAKATGKSVDQIVALKDKGKLGRVEMELLFKALETGKGLERFTGLMAAQSMTLNGVISTMKDTFKGAAIDFFTPYLPQMTKAVTAFTKLITDKVIPQLRLYVTAVDKYIRIFVNAYRGGAVGVDNSGFARAIERIAKIIRTFQDTIGSGQSLDAFLAQLKIGASEAKGGLAQGLADLVYIIGHLFSALPELNTTLAVLGTVMKFVAEHIDVIVELMPYIIAGWLIWKVGQLAVNLAALFSLPIMAAQAAGHLALSRSIRLQVNANKELAISQGLVEARVGFFGKALDALKGKKVKIEQTGAEAATKSAEDTRRAIEKLSNKTITITEETKHTTDEKAGGPKFDTGRKLPTSAITGAISGVAGAIGGALAAALAGVLTAAVIVPALIVVAVVAAATLIYKFREPIWRFFTETLPRFFTDTVPDMLGKAMNWGETIAEKGRELVNGLWQGIQVKWDELLVWLKELPMKAAYGLGFLVGTLYDKGKDLLSGLWNGITNVWDTNFKFWSELPGKVQVGLGDLMSTLWQKGSDLLQGLWTGVNWVWDANVWWFTEMPRIVIDKIGDVLSTLWQKGSDLLGGLWKGIQAAWADPEGFFTSLADTVRAKVGDAASWLVEKGKAVIQGFWDGIQFVWHTVHTFFTETVPNISASVGDLRTKLFNSGVDLIQGLLDGIEKMWDSVTKKAGDLGGAFLKGFRDATDEKSPSREMMKSGVHLMDGLTMGIDSKMGELKTTVAAVSKLALGDFDLAAVNGSVNASLAGAGALGQTTNNNQNVTVELNVHGVTNAEGFDRVIPHLTSAIRAGVGKNN